MADIPSPGSYTKLNDSEINFNQPIDTPLFTKIGGDINKLIDDMESSSGIIGGLTNFVTLSGTYNSYYDSGAGTTNIDLNTFTSTRFLLQVIYISQASVLSWNTNVKSLVRSVTTTGAPVDQIIDASFHSTIPSTTQRSFPYWRSSSGLGETMIHFDKTPELFIPTYVSTTYRITWPGNSPGSLNINGYIFET